MKTTVYLSERDKKTLISLLRDIDSSVSPWGSDCDGMRRDGVEMDITPRQWGFIRKFLKELECK